jgi:hypothetical protein
MISGEGFMEIISLFAICFSLVAMVASFACIAVVVGLRNSTHKIEYRPIPQPDEKMRFDPKDLEDLEGASAEMEKKLKAEIKLNPVMAGFKSMYDEIN